MSDSFVEELLKRWGVPQLLDRCKEQEVDLDALRSLKENVITELVPLIGPRCKFLKGWRLWKEAGAPAPSTLLPGGGAASTSAPATATSAFSPSPSSPRSPVDTPGPAAAAAAAAQATAARRTTTPAPAISSRRLSENEFEPADGAGDGAGGGAGDKKEVAVFLRGRITYNDDDDPSAGWLVADGYLTKRGDRTIKAEPKDDLPPEMDVTLENNDPSKRPRFQLQGRITLSLQEFQEVPSFMIATAGPSVPHMEDSSCSMPSEGLGHQQQYLQQAQQAHQEQLAKANTFLSFCDSYPYPEMSRASTTPPARGNKRPRNNKLDLEAMLNSTSKGKMILSLYRQRNCLDGPARQTLTDLIIAEELREDFNKRITSQRFQEIAETIVELFPGENEDTYFCNDRSFGDRPGGKGKLTSKYYNTRRQLAKSGVICRGHNKERRQNIQQSILAAFQSTPEEDAIGQQNAKWLQSLGWHMELSPEDLETAMQRWRGCWKIRLLRVLSPGHDPSAYLDEYPILRMPIGETLINADFDILFKNAGNRLVCDWPNFCQAIMAMLAEEYRKQIPLLDTVKRSVTTVEGKQVGALLLLPSMLPVTTCKGSGDSSELWRPTRQEAQDGFLLHVEHDEDVTSALERHWARMRLMGQPVSPLPVVVGQSLDQLQTALVAVDDNTAFYVPNALCAVDLCFKCFHSLQVPYPPQAQNVWLFLQHAVYQLAAPTDRMSVAVSSLLADFGFRPVPPVASWDQVLSPATAPPATSKPE